MNHAHVSASTTTGGKLMPIIKQHTRKTKRGLVTVKQYTRTSNLTTSGLPTSRIKALKTKAAKIRAKFSNDGWSGHRMRATKNSWNPWS